MTNVTRFQTAGTVLAGAGSSLRIGQEVRNLGVSRPLVITDPGIAQSEILGRVASGLEEAGLSVATFEEVSADPSVEVVRAAADAFRESAADGIIALGGGSSIDAAKAAAVVASNGGSASDYQGARDAYPSPLPPLVAIPTTAGTGSEAGSASLITDLQKREKMVIKSPSLFVRLAVLDPDLLASLPRAVAAQTALDALSHTVESYVSRLRTPLTQELSLAAARRIGASLRRYLQDGDDPGAAEDMIHASCMAGMAMSNAGLGLVHALAHPLGVLAKLPHGVACAIFLPPVIRFNRALAGEGYAQLAETLSPALWPGPGGEGIFSAEALADGIERLVEEVGIPRRLGAIGRKTALPQEKVGSVLSSVQCRTNPRPIDRGSLLAVWEEVQ
ncbi:MAG: iron-containing alcohol dehydrogenase family protein [Nitrospinota bacterium]